MEFPFRENRFPDRSWNFRSVKVVGNIDHGILVPQNSSAKHFPKNGFLKNAGREQFWWKTSKT
jgi:hypothetical protein